MSLATILAVSRQELRLIWSDPTPYVLLALMPLGIASFVKPAFEAMLAAESGAEGGAQLAVPAMTIMFGFFLTSNVGHAFFYEHRWNTWDRVRAEALTPVELVLGKTLPYVVLVTLYQVAVLAAGALLLGLRVEGPLPALALAIVPFAIALVTFAFALVAVCRNVRQLQAYSSLSGMLFAGLAGALTPLHLLPSWTQAIAPWTPGYWGLRGLTEIVRGADALGIGLRAALALLAFSAVFSLIGMSQFRPSERKLYPS